MTAPPAPPCVMVIFGASGDLTRRKLLPALYHLRRDGQLNEQFIVLGSARTPLDDQGFRDLAAQALKACDNGQPAADDVEWLIRRMHYVPLDASEPGAYRALASRLEALDREHATDGNVLFYLATAPQLFGRIVKDLGGVGLTRENGSWRRVVIEKPFGSDLASARELNRELRGVLGERQIYRIDHYLGKETVQNILAFRFGNGVFEPIWNRRYVDHVQITASERDGVGERGGYYDGSGALRDMVPNHLFQLISLTAMEPPISFAADAVRDEQTKVLEAIQRFTPDEVRARVVRGQYGEGVIDGRAVPGYRQEHNVPADSATETFVALKLFIDNWRWSGVPFYIRTGKRLPVRETEITIQFKPAPLRLFRDTPVDALQPNHLVLHIQPDEGISLSFGAKIPGPQLRLGEVDMRFHYVDYFGCRLSTGYERLLYDCMIGDATLFQRADMVEAAWDVVQPILEVWSENRPDFPNYAAGTWGPPAGVELMSRSGRRWRDGDDVSEPPRRI
ncbi:MAG TPA: glucose-6-phosphate dehydrogenase [Vicinamibacterales bacterium]|nr:glucose-6-phosphate dehydrogenase [Vicinamibacterales bacterium]